MQLEALQLGSRQRHNGKFDETDRGPRAPPAIDPKYITTKQLRTDTSPAERHGQ